MGTEFTVINAFTTPATAALRLVAPDELSTTLPEILPDWAEAAERTYIVVLFTVPADWVRITLLPYPLPEEGDTSKPVGAVAVIFADRPLPETVNCWILGLADAVPIQAEMLPVTAPAVIVEAGFNLLEAPGAPFVTTLPELLLTDVADAGFA